MKFVYRFNKPKYLIDLCQVIEWNDNSLMFKFLGFEIGLEKKVKNEEFEWRLFKQFTS